MAVRHKRSIHLTKAVVDAAFQLWLVVTRAGDLGHKACTMAQDLQ